MATKYFSYFSTISAALTFAVCHLATAGIEGILHDAYMAKVVRESPEWYLLTFAQTEMLLLLAVAIPAWHYRKFLSKTRKSGSSSKSGHATRIGGLSLFVAGFLSLAQLSPEQLSAMLTNPSFLTLPGVKINYLTFLGVSRLIVFPVLGIAACQCVRKLQAAR